MTTQYVKDFLEIYFNDKPDATTREQLKAKGYKWFPPKKCRTKYKGDLKEIDFLSGGKEVCPIVYTDDFPDDWISDMVYELQKKDKQISELKSKMETPSVELYVDTSEITDELADFVGRVEKQIEYNSKYSPQSWELPRNILDTIKEILNSEYNISSDNISKVSLSRKNKSCKHYDS